MLYALRVGDAAGERLRALLDTRSPTTTSTPRRCACCARRSAMDEARATLRDYADARSRRCSTGLPDMPARAAFAALTDTVIDRTG